LLNIETVEQARKRLAQNLNAKSNAKDPVKWARYMLGEEYVPWSKIREFFYKVLSDRKSICYSINSAGKSFSVIGILSLWWMDTYGRNAKVMIVTPSFDQSKNAMGYIKQLNDIIEERFKSGIIDHCVGGKVVREVEYTARDWPGGIVARNPVPQDAKNTIKGAHSTGGSLIILEEANGLQYLAIDAAKNVVTGKKDKLVAVTNPNNPDSYIMQVVQKWKDTGESDWAISHIGWEDMPAYTGEEVPELQRLHLCDQQYVDDVVGEFGYDSPEYRVKVLGEPDYENETTLIRYDDVNVGVNVEYPLTDWEPRPVFGVDVAGYGSDNTVIYSALTKPVEFSTEDEEGNTSRFVQPMTRIRFLADITKNDVSLRDQAFWAIRLALDNNAREVRFDASVIGQSFGDDLNDAMADAGYPDIRLVKMVAAGRDFEKERYGNNKTYWWGTMKERLRAGEIDLDPKDDRLHKELMRSPYDENETGSIKLKPKRLLAKSPDYADAAVFCAVRDDVIDGFLTPKKDNVVVYEPSDRQFGDYDDEDPFEDYFPIYDEVYV